MRRRESRDMSNEEFDDWIAASNRQDEVAEAADEEGGPRLSLVPFNEHAAPWPTDLLPPAPKASRPVRILEPFGLPAGPDRAAHTP